MPRLGPCRRPASSGGPSPATLHRTSSSGDFDGESSGLDSEGPDPRLLEAPPPQARSQLRRLQLEGKWEQLLEAAEQVMGTPAGRGWLDLQRYTLSACAGLGDGFHQVARAVAHELSTLLSELPGLPEMTLMDDMPTASRETQQWLHEMGFGNGTEAVKGAVAARVLDGAGEVGERRRTQRSIEPWPKSGRGGRSARNRAADGRSGQGAKPARAFPQAHPDRAHHGGRRDGADRHARYCSICWR